VKSFLRDLGCGWRVSKKRGPISTLREQLPWRGGDFEEEERQGEGFVQGLLNDTSIGEKVLRAYSGELLESGKNYEKSRRIEDAYKGGILDVWKGLGM